MIVATGSVTARPETFEAIRQVSLDHVHRSRAEDGCISHAVHVDAENPLRLFFFERWRDLDSLKQHIRQPGSLQFLRELRALDAETGTITLYEASDLPL